MATTQELKDPIGIFNAKIDAKVQQGIPKVKAIGQVVAENPELHSAYLQEFNRQHPTHPIDRERKRRAAKR
jgi:hypothetical protein